MTSNKPNKKLEITIEEITNDINSAEYKGKNRSKVMNSVVTNILKLANVKKKSIDGKTINIKNTTAELFNKCCDIFENDVHIFMLKLSMKLFPKFKSQNINKGLTVYSTLKDMINKRTYDMLNKHGFNNPILDEFSSANIDDLEILSELINQLINNAFLLDKKASSDLIQDDITILLCLYTLTCNYNYRYTDFIVLLYRAISNKLSNVDNNKVLEKFILKEFSSALLSKKPILQYNKYVFLWQGMQEKLDELELKNLDLKQYNINIIDEKEILRNNNLELKKIITSKENVIKETQNEIEKLKLANNACENRLLFEKNKYEQQYLSLQKGLKSQIISSLEYELEGLKEIMQYLPEKESNLIKYRVEKITEIISSIGEK